MAGIVFDINVDFQRLNQLKKELDDLKVKLISMDKAADPKAFKQLEKQLQSTKKEYDSLATKASEAGKKMEKSMKDTLSSSNGLLSVLAKLGGAALFGKLISDVVSVRGEFQQLDVAFRTLLQSKDKADALMAQMVQTAAKTPFTLQEVAGGAKQLIAYGFASETVNDTLIRLGNVASGLGLPLERLTYLYGTTMTQGRLYARDLMQWTTSGIPMLQGLADMYGVNASEANKMVEAGKIGFPEVQQVLQNLTNEGGKFYNLMEEQSKTITGQISNIKDQLSLMYNTIGQGNEGLINSGISGIRFMIDHYEEIGKSLAMLVAAYGSYKAAIITTIAVQQAGVFIENIRLIGMFRKELGLLTAAQQAFNLSAKVNPYILLLTVLGTAAAAMAIFSKHTTSAADSQGRLNDAMEKSKQDAADEKAKAQVLTEQIKNENLSRSERSRLLKELISLSPTHLGALTLENVATATGKTAIDNYNAALLRKIQIQEIEKQLADSIRKQEDAESGKNKISVVKKGLFAIGAAEGGLDYGKTEESANKELNEKILKDEMNFQKKLREQLQKLSSNNSDPISTTTTPTTTPTETKDFETEARKNATTAKRLTEDLANDVIQSNILIQKDGDAKVLAQMELDHELKILAINRQEEDLLQTLRDNAEKEWKAKGNKGKFNTDSVQLDSTSKGYYSTLRDNEDSSFIKQQKAKLDAALKEFESFQQKRERISKEYDDKIKLFGDNPEYAGNKKQAETEKSEALTALDQEIANREVTFTVWADKIASMGLKQLVSALETAKATLESAGGLSEEEKAVLRSKVVTLQNKVKEESAKADDPDKSKKKWSDTLKTMNEVNETVENIVSSFDGLDEATKNALTSASNVAGGIIGMITGIQALSNAAAASMSAVEKASVILGIIGAAFQIVSAIVNLFSAASTAKYERAIEKLEIRIRSLTDAYDELADAEGRAQGAEKYNFTGDRAKNLKDQIKTYDDLINKETERAIAAKKADDAWYWFWERPKELEYYIDDEKIKGWEADRKQAAKELALLYPQIVDSVVGTADEIATELSDAMFEAFANGEDAAEAWGKKVDEIIGRIVKNLIVAEFITPQIKDIITKYSAGWKDEEGNFDPTRFNESAESFAKDIKGVGEAIPAVLGMIDKYFPGSTSGSTSGSSSGSSSSGFASASQDSISELNGRFTALQMSGVNIENTTLKISDDVSQIRDILSKETPGITPGDSPGLTPNDSPRKSMDDYPIFNIQSNTGQDNLILTDGVKGILEQQILHSDIMTQQNNWLEQSRNIQLQSMYHLADISKNTKTTNDKLDTIIKNTNDM